MRWGLFNYFINILGGGGGGYIDAYFHLFAMLKYVYGGRVKSLKKYVYVIHERPLVLIYVFIAKVTNTFLENKCVLYCEIAQITFQPCFAVN